LETAPGQPGTTATVDTTIEHTGKGDAATNEQQSNDNDGNEDIRDLLHPDDDSSTSSGEFDDDDILDVEATLEDDDNDDIISPQPL
jgi:hypothetical protein